MANIANRAELDKLFWSELDFCVETFLLWPTLQFSVLFEDVGNMTFNENQSEKHD